MSDTHRIFVPLALPPAVVPEASAQILTFSGPTMGSTWSAKALPHTASRNLELESEIQRVLDTVIEQMSTWEAHSDISRFNDAPAGSWQELPAEFFAVLACAMEVAEQSGGAYDPTIGPLVNLWGFGPTGKRSTLPSADEIEKEAARCGWRRLHLDREQRRMQQPGSAYIDLSAIAKGFAVDLISSRAKALGCVSYLVEVGGELRGFGLKPDGGPWWVELEEPFASADMQRSLVALHGLSVATSGNYRRYFDADGRRYAHTIDPRTGYPLSHELASVSVLHESCMLADAWSTALYVLGPEEGLALAAARGLAARFVQMREGARVEHLSPLMEQMLD